MNLKKKLTLFQIPHAFVFMTNHKEAYKSHSYQKHRHNEVIKVATLLFLEYLVSSENRLTTKKELLAKSLRQN